MVSGMGDALAKSSGTLAIRKGEIDEKMISLRIEPDGGKGFTHILLEKSLDIGASSSNTLAIRDAVGISPFHARLRADGFGHRLFALVADGQFFVKVNDTLISGSTVLKDGDVVRLENIQRQGATIYYSNPLERSNAMPLIAKFHNFDRFPFKIGRSPDAGVKLSSLAVSWNHAEIREAGGAHTLVDLGSTNGTYVNDRLLNAPHRLKPDDVIRIDQFLYIYKGNGLQAKSAVQTFQLDAQDLEVTYQTGLNRAKLNTMRGVSLSIAPREFVAILGGSGSGKSTLLRALNGAQPATGGEVLINGTPMYKHYDLFRSQIGYVPQADIVHNELSVYQSLWYSAQLRFPNEPKEAREQRINRVLDDLALTHYKDRQVGRLSGGQKKRVSIASELMAEPALLFMDEPSSGLDEGLDRAMMKTLRRLADRGHIVIIVTHTTGNIDLCDYLCVMAQGNLVFFGKPKEALDHFGIKRYAELYDKVQAPPGQDAPELPQGTLMMRIEDMQAASPSGAKMSAAEASAQWGERYRNSPLYVSYVNERTRGLSPTAEVLPDKLRRIRAGTFIQQARILTARTLALVRRTGATSLILLLVLPLIGLFLAGINFNGAVGDRGMMLTGLANSGDLEKVAQLKVVPECTGSLNPGEEVTPMDKKPSWCKFKESDGLNFYINQMGSWAPAGDAQRLLFMMSLSATLLGIFASAYTVVVERSLFLREKMVNVRVRPYLFSKMVVYGGLTVISCALLTVAVVLGVHYPGQGQIMWGPLEIFITLALTGLGGVSLGLMLSALNKSVNTITYLVLGFLFVQILFPGVLFRMEGALEAVSKITLTRWSLEALGSTANIETRDAEGRVVLINTRYNEKGEKLRRPAAQQVYAGSTLNFTYPHVESTVTLEDGSVKLVKTPTGLLSGWGMLVVFNAIFLAIAGLALRRQESF
jgi:ABC-type multidrug transport system ATPase subunit